MAIVNQGRLEAVDGLLTELSQIVRKARVEGDLDGLRYIQERLDETGQGIRGALEQLDRHPRRK